MQKLNYDLPGTLQTSSSSLHIIPYPKKSIEKKLAPLLGFGRCFLSHISIVCGNDKKYNANQATIN